MVLARDSAEATVGFEKLGADTGTQPQSLIRAFGPRGNPRARNLFNVPHRLQRQAGVELHVPQGRRYRRGRNSRTPPNKRCWASARTRP
jgi:DNA-binding phage protein